MNIRELHHGFVGFGKRVAALSVAVWALGAAASQAQTPRVVFDNISNAENGVTGATITATTSTPNTFMGDGYTLAAGTTSITGFDVFPYNNSGTNYTGLQINIYVWGSVNTGTISAANPAFSNLLNTITLTSTGNFATGSYYSFENATPGSAPGITLGAPLTIPGNTVGITLSYAGTTNGTTFATANNLTSVLSYGTPPTTGSLTLGGTTGGYFRNGNGEVNGNFTSGVRSLGFTYQGVALRVYGNVPEPGTWAMIVLGAGVLVVWQARRRTVLARN